MRSFLPSLVSNAASMPTILPQCRWISFPPPPPPLHLEIVHSGGLLAPSARPSVPPSVLPSSLPPPPRPREEGGDGGGGRKGSWKAPRTALAACDLIRLLDPILAEEGDGGTAVAAAMQALFHPVRCRHHYRNPLQSVSIPPPPMGRSVLVGVN